MACACKVNNHIDKIYKQYGTHKPLVKTNIKEKIIKGVGNVFIWILSIPIMPLIFLYFLIRKLITNKPISINGFVKQVKNVKK